MKRIFVIYLMTILVVLSACTSSYQLEPSDSSITIMTFNVENLFDTTHDAGKDDYTYLPAASKNNIEHRQRCEKIEVERWREQCLNWDWTERVVAYKLEKIADVIRQVNNGHGADIIAFQEVENIGLLERLRDEYLPNLGYQLPVLVEGADLRGIDVAFLSRLPLVSAPTLHPIEFGNVEERRREDTRGILQANFALPDGSVLTGFAVHFPAPYHPFQMRIDAYNSLTRLTQRLPAERLVFAAGDFNTPGEEDRQYAILDTHVKPLWHIAHQISCKSCPGSHYYEPKDEWSFLDMILIRKNPGSAWSLRPGKTHLANRVIEQTDSAGHPRRFDLDELSGVSDHWPLVIELQRKK